MAGGVVIRGPWADPAEPEPVEASRADAGAVFVALLGCSWNNCRRPGRLFPCGERCAAHTPLALRGLPELPPGPGWPRDRTGGGEA